jgi:hypothetical protein
MLLNFIYAKESLFVLKFRKIISRQDFLKFSTYIKLYLLFAFMHDFWIEEPILVGMNLHRRK